MRKVAALIVLAAALTGCVTTGSSTSAGIRPLGGDTYMVSEMSGFGNVVERASAFCGYFNQTMQITGNTSQMGLVSGQQYAVITFRCVSPAAPN